MGSNFFGLGTRFTRVLIEGGLVSHWKYMLLMQNATIFQMRGLPSRSEHYVPRYRDFKFVDLFSGKVTLPLGHFPKLEKAIFAHRSDSESYNHKSEVLAWGHQTLTHSNSTQSLIQNLALFALAVSWIFAKITKNLLGLIFKRLFDLFPCRYQSNSWKYEILRRSFTRFTYFNNFKHFQNKNLQNSWKLKKNFRKII